MNITVFGSTGGTGQEVVKQLLNRGHQVTAFARIPANVPMNGHENLTIVQGNVLNIADVEKAITPDTDVVVTVLGHRRGVNQGALLEKSAQYMIQAMQAKSVKRLIALSGAGAWISDKDKPGILEHVIRFALKSLSGHVLADSEKMAEVIMQSDLNWVIPRGPRIVEGEHKGEYRVGYVGVGTGIMISYADMANFIVDEVEQRQYTHDAPVVSY